MTAHLPRQSPAVLIGRAEQHQFPHAGIRVKCGPWDGERIGICRVAIILPSLRIVCAAFQMRPAGERWRIVGYSHGPGWCPAPDRRPGQGGRAE